MSREPSTAELEAQIRAAATRAGFAPSGNGSHGPGEDPDGNALALTVIPWRDMVSAEPVPVAYHWHGWIALATVAVLAGAGDSLKSWLCLYLAVMTAAGRAPFAAAGTEEPAIAPGPVVYLTAENAIAEEQRRCQLLKAGLELPEDLPVYFVPAENLSLDRDPDYQAVVALVEELRPVALFVDSAIALSGLQNENDNQAVRRFMKGRILPFSRIHQLTVYVIQHSPKPPTKPGERMTDEHVARGASDWRNAADAVLYLRRDPSLGELAVILRHAKQRVGPRHRPVWFRLEDVEPEKAVRLVYGGAYSDDAQGIQAGVQKAITAIVGVLKGSTSGIYQRELSDQVLGGGISKATYRRALDVVRGKKPWPYGPHRGNPRAVATEDRVGKHVILTLDVAAWPSDEEWDDA